MKKSWWGYIFMLGILLALIQTAAFLRIGTRPVQTVRWLVPQKSVQSAVMADADRDGIAECISLRSGSAVLQRVMAADACPDKASAEILWQSPPGWEVVQAHWTEVNGDDLPELALLVWRAYRPWYVDRYLPYAGRTAGFHDQEGRSCHLILIGWKRGAYREIWAGSALAEPVVSFSTLDISGDQREELLTLDSNYGERKYNRVKSLGIWEWNGFGFTLIHRIEGGQALFPSAYN